MPDGAADFETVFARNHDVENEQRRALAFGVGKNIGPRGIDADDEAFVFKVVPDQARNVGVVFDNEDAGFHKNIVTKLVRGT